MTKMEFPVIIKTYFFPGGCLPTRKTASLKRERPQVKYRIRIKIGLYSSKIRGTV